MPKSAPKNRVPPSGPTQNGTFIYPDGSSYTGQYNPTTPPERHGQGTYTCAQTQTTFTGMFAHDEPVHGKITFGTTGAFYEGGFGKGPDLVFHGKGVYGAVDGEHVEGNWVNGRLEGVGRVMDKEGRWWIGGFMKGTGRGLVGEVI